MKYHGGSVGQRGFHRLCEALSIGLGLNTYLSRQINATMDQRLRSLLVLSQRQLSWPLCPQLLSPKLTKKAHDY